MKQLLTELKEEAETNTVIVRDLNTPLTVMNRSFKQKINKEIFALSDTLHHMDITDIYRTFHPRTPDYTFFPSAHGTVSRIDHMLSHKTSLNKFKKIEIITSIFCDHSSLTLEINCQKKAEKKKNPTHVEIKQHITKND